MGASAVAALVVVIMVTFVGQALAVTVLSGWFAHGLFAVPWGLLTVLIYIPVALIDDRRRGSRIG